MAPSTSTTEPASLESWRPLLAWSLGALFFFYAFVQRVSPSVMVGDLMRDFGVGAAILGNLSAFYFYAYAILQIPVGVLMDRIGPRRLMTAAAALCAVGSLLFAVSDALAGAYAGRLLIGAGAAFSWIGVLTVVGQWFPPARFALFAGLAQAAGMAGAVFGQAPLSLAVGAVGWRGALAAVAAAGLVLAVFLWIVVRDRPHAASSAVGIGTSLGIVLRNRNTALCAVFCGAMTAPILSFAGLWAVPYLSAVYGLERAQAAAVASLMFVGWGISSPIMGLLSDLMGRRKPLMIAGAVVATVSLVALFYAPGLTLPLAVVLIVMHGAAASAMIIGFALAREHNPPGMGGSAMGIVNVAVTGSGALFQPLVGLFLDMNWGGELVAGVRVYAPDSYRLALAVLPIGCVVGLAATLPMKETFCRQRGAA